MSFKNPFPPGSLNFNLFPKLVFTFFVGLELTIGIILFSGYTETFHIMQKTFLSELPLLGPVFSYAPDLNAGQLLCAMMALFSIGVFLVAFNFIEKEKIFLDFRDWISHPQNQIAAGLMITLILIVIALEVATIFHLLTPDKATGAFVTQTAPKGVQALMQKSITASFIVALILVIMNAAIAYFSVQSIHNLKKKGGHL